MSRPRNAPIRTFLDPRVEVYAPTESFPFYRVVGYSRDDKRVINTSGGSTIRKAKAKAEGQGRSFINWLMDRGLLDRNPMYGVSYSMTKADNAGLDPKAVRPDETPNLEMVYPLAYWLARMVGRGTAELDGKPRVSRPARRAWPAGRAVVRQRPCSRHGAGVSIPWWLGWMRRGRAARDPRARRDDRGQRPS